MGLFLVFDLAEAPTAGVGPSPCAVWLKAGRCKKKTPGAVGPGWEHFSEHLVAENGVITV